jgi:Mrp family chromosome partitioning ATPase
MNRLSSTSASAAGVATPPEFGDLRQRIDELAYRLLVAFPPEGGRPKLLLITSVRVGEGKTTLACAVSHAMAALSGEAVLLSDANPCRPALQALFELPGNSPGFFDVLRGNIEGLKALHPQPGGQATVLPAGDHPDPALLFRAPAIRGFRDAAQDYRCVVLDGGTTHLGGGSLGQHADGVIVVIDSSRTRREVVRGGIEAMRLPEGRLCGVILNKRIQYIPRFFYRRF